MADQPRQRRSFRNIIKFFKILTALIFVFWASFFITLAIRSNHPIDYLYSYIEDFFGLSESPPKETTLPKEKKSAADKLPATERKVDVDKMYSTDKQSVPVTEKTGAVTNFNEDAGVFGSVGVMFDIESAVNNRVKSIPNYVALKDISRELQNAIIAVEDTRFYSHSGFDVEGIARAAVVNVEAGQIEEGASTITQQLVKNMFLSSEQSFTRKAEELLLAMNIERHFSKDKIMELYLNTIYFGSNFYGVYAASQGYFGKDPKDLTIGEATMLAGLPNAPSLYSPYVDFMLAKKRQLVVINAMTRTHLLNERDAENARIEEIVLIRSIDR